MSFPMYLYMGVYYTFGSSSGCSISSRACRIRYKFVVSKSWMPDRGFILERHRVTLRMVVYYNASVHIGTRYSGLGQGKNNLRFPSKHNRVSWFRPREKKNGYGTIKPIFQKKNITHCKPFIQSTLLVAKMPLFPSSIHLVIRCSSLGQGKNKKCLRFPSTPYFFSINVKMTQYQFLQFLPTLRDI